jgi:4-amino-4-deoxy-L-arabinose transferase-like glycosyltransferase
VSNPALLIFTKLPVKMLLMLVWFGALVLWYRRRVIQAHHVMIMSWFAASLVASTLSNRPYPHYFLQVLPPLVFCGGVAIDAVVAVLRRARYSRNALVVLALCVVCGATAYGTGKLLQLGTYPTLSYYQHYWNWITGKLTWQAYAQAFHPFWQDNATLTSIITANPEPYLFIWGDNPILYAQTGKIPVGRFTVAFHIKDFRAQQETLQAALEKKPPFVVVINDDRTTLPGLDGFLDTFYIRDQTPLQYMTLYRRVRK